MACTVFLSVVVSHQNTTEYKLIYKHAFNSKPYSPLIKEKAWSWFDSSNLKFCNLMI